MTVVEGSTDKQTRLIAYDDLYTLAGTSGGPCLTEIPHRPLMFRLILPCPRAAGTIRCRRSAPLPQTSVAGHVYPQPGSSTGVPGPLHLHGVLSCLALSTLRSCSCPYPMACCPIFHFPPRGSCVSSSSHMLRWVYGYLVSDYSLPQWGLFPQWEKRGVPEACPLLSRKAEGPVEPGSCRMNFTA